MVIQGILCGGMYTGQSVAHKVKQIEDKVLQAIIIVKRKAVDEDGWKQGGKDGHDRGSFDHGGDDGEYSRKDGA